MELLQILNITQHLARHLLAHVRTVISHMHKHFLAFVEKIFTSNVLSSSRNKMITSSLFIEANFSSVSLNTSFTPKDTFPLVTQFLPAHINSTGLNWSGGGRKEWMAMFSQNPVLQVRYTGLWWFANPYKSKPAQIFCALNCFFMQERYHVAFLYIRCWSWIDLNIVVRIITYYQNAKWG
jgi:hypothetical protein